MVLISSPFWTAGVGENQTGLRWDACQDMEYLGIKLDKERNMCRGEGKILSTDDSKVKGGTCSYR